MVKLLVNGAEKADALTQLLPAKKQFGNVTLTIQIVPANRLELNKLDLFRKAFAGNDAISFFKSVVGLYDTPLNFIVFKKEVVQYFTDDLGDLHHVRSTLYQDIAKELFGEHTGIFLLY